MTTNAKPIGDQMFVHRFKALFEDHTDVFQWSGYPYAGSLLTWIRRIDTRVYLKSDYDFDTLVWISPPVWGPTRHLVNCGLVYNRMIPGTILGRPLILNGGSTTYSQWRLTGVGDVIDD